MSRTVWRITKLRYASAAYEGEGARMFGGRWNREGLPVAYAAENLSLAALETLVHVSASQVLPDQVAIPCRIPDELATDAWVEDDLPDDWRTVEGHEELRAMGSDWLANGTSCVLLVPSVVIPEENNVLINPEHPDFSQLDIGETRAFRFDPRLLS